MLQNPAVLRRAVGVVGIPGPGSLRHAPRRLPDRHPRDARQRAGFAVPRRGGRNQRLAVRHRDLRRRPHQPGQRRRTGICPRADLTARKTVARRAGQPRDHVVRKRLHDLRPDLRPRRAHRLPGRGLPLSGLRFGTFYEDGHGSGAHRGPRVAGRGGRQGPARPAHREPLPLSAEQRPHEPHGGDGDAPAAGYPAHAVRPLPPRTLAVQLRLHSRHSGTRPARQERFRRGLHTARLLGRLGPCARKDAGRGAAHPLHDPHAGRPANAGPRLRPDAPGSRLQGACAACVAGQRHNLHRSGLLQGPGVLRHDAGRAAGLRHAPQSRGVASAFRRGALHHAPRGRRAGHRGHDDRRTANGGTSTPRRRSSGRDSSRAADPTPCSTSVWATARWPKSR